MVEVILILSFALSMILIPLCIMNLIFSYRRVIFKTNGVVVKYNEDSNRFFVTHNYVIDIPKFKSGELRFCEPEDFCFFVEKDKARENYKGICIMNVLEYGDESEY